MEVVTLAVTACLGLGGYGQDSKGRPEVTIRQVEVQRLQCFTALQCTLAL